MRALSMLPVLVALAVPFRAAAQAPSSSGWFGLSFACEGCIGTARDAGSRPAIITGIVPGGPAERAHLAVGDTVLTLGGRPLPAHEAQSALAAARPGTVVEMLIGTRRGRFNYRVKKDADSLRKVGGAALPLRYQGEFAGVGVDVLTQGSPVITRDSTGAMLISVGGHVVRLRPSQTVAATGGDR
jgi:hypothetical protein